MSELARCHFCRCPIFDGETDRCVDCGAVRGSTPNMLRTLALGFWWAMVAVLTYLAVAQLSGCALDVGGEGDPTVTKRGRDAELELEPDDAAAPAKPDAGAELERDAAQVDAVVDAGAELERDAGPHQVDGRVPDAAAPAGLGGAWTVKLVRRVGSGCTGRPAAATQVWELAPDLGHVSTPWGELERLPAPPDLWWQTEGEQPVVRVELEQLKVGVLRGQLLIETPSFCLETWAAEGSR